MDTSIYIFQECPHSLGMVIPSLFPTPSKPLHFPSLSLLSILLNSPPYLASFPQIPHQIPPTTPASVPLHPKPISFCPSHLSPYQYHSKPLLHCNYLTNQPTQSLSHYWCYYSSEQDCKVLVNLEEVKVLALERLLEI